MSSSHQSRSVSSQKAKGPSTTTTKTTTKPNPKKSKQQQHPAAEYYSAMSYPMLTTGEIVECLLELGVEGVTEEEIKDPHRHKDRMKQIYLRILGNCQGVTEEDLDMPTGAAALEAVASKENLPDELHTRAWTHIAFFRVVQKFLARCGYTDFGLRDLVKPEKGRFLRQLCAMLAFVKFQDALLGQFYELCQTRDQIYASIAQVEQDMLELRGQEDELKMQQPQAAESYDVCQKDCLELENEMKRVTQINSKLRTELENMNKAKAKLKDDVEGAELSVQECAAELHKWRTRLVQSPERKMQGIQQKTQLLEVIKGEVREMEQQWNASKASKNQRRDVCQALDGLRLDALIDLADVAQRSAQRNRDGQIKVVAAEQESQQVEATVTQAEREYQRQYEHCAGEKKRHELQFVAAQESHDTVLDQLLRLEKDRRDAMARTEQGEREVAALSAQLEEEKRLADETVQNMVGQYRIQERAWKGRLELQMKELGIAAAAEHE